MQLPKILYPSARPTPSPIPIRIASLLTILAIVIPGSSAYSEPTEHSASPTELALYHGLWRRIVDPREDRERLHNIDSAIASLSWIVQRMAAGVLKRSTAPPTEMRFEWDGEKLHQVVAGESDAPSIRPVEFGSEPQKHRDPRGEDFASSWTWTKDGLQVDWRQEQAHGSNRYRVDPRDQTLLVEHRIQVTALSGIEPIVFHSRFGLASPAPVGSAMADSGESAARGADVR